ncbi:MAG: HEAT repeat domain-containing protein [Pirellulaceae bacterium]
MDSTKPAATKSAAADPTLAVPAAKVDAAKPVGVADGGSPNAANAVPQKLDPAVMSTVKSLLVQMSSEANLERRAGTEGLDEMGPSVVDPYLTAALTSGTEAEKRGAAAYLISRVALQDDVMLAALIGALASTDDVLRHNAFQAIEKVSHEQLRRALPALIELVKNLQEEKNYRARAVRTIAKLGEEGRVAAPDLMQLAGDNSEPELQRAAYDAITKVATAEDAENFFVEVLKSNPSVDLRRVAAKRLVQATVSPQAPAGLVAAFKDPAAEVRNEAINSLLAIGRPALPQLIQGLQDPDVQVRRRAVLTLGKLNNVAVEAVPALQERLQDADPQVRGLAEASLKLIQGK